MSRHMAFNFEMAKCRQHGGGGIDPALNAGRRRGQTADNMVEYASVPDSGGKPGAAKLSMLCGVIWYLVMLPMFVAIGARVGEFRGVQNESPFTSCIRGSISVAAAVVL